MYLSRSTSARSSGFAGIDPEVGRILLKSRTNNKRAGLTGVLYFGSLEAAEEFEATTRSRLSTSAAHRPGPVTAARTSY